MKDFRKKVFLKSLIFFTLVLFFFYPVCAGSVDKKGSESQGFQISKKPEVQQVKPKKPLRIKLQRNAKGDYSWDITGDNVDEIVKADRRLRKLILEE